MSARVSITEDDVMALAAMPVLPDPDPFLFHNPSKQLQERVVGQSFEKTYGEAAHFLNYLIDTAFGEKLPARILDFGCGWGRMLRMLRFKEELKYIEMHGCDITPEFMDTVRRSVPNVYLGICQRTPPLPYVEDWFDVIYAFSVFSHLSPESHLEWAQQFARVIKPGGRVVITTQGLKFLEYSRALREGVLPITHPWHDMISKSFTESDCAERFERGEFLYAATTPSVPVYGEAVVPKAWFEKHWGELGFKVVGWDESGVQNYCAMVYRG